MEEAEQQNMQKKWKRDLCSQMMWIMIPLRIADVDSYSSLKNVCDSGSNDDFILQR